MAVIRGWRDEAGHLHEGSVVSESEYDGQGRRIVYRVTNNGDRNATYHHYHAGGSQIEMRNGSDLVLQQWVWGGLSGGYIDDLVQVGVNSDPFVGDTCDTFYWSLVDNHFNVLGLNVTLDLLVLPRSVSR